MRFRLKDFEYNENAMTVTAWMTPSWNDTRLIWNPSDYSEISTIHMKSNELWHPSLKVYNAKVDTSLGTCHIVDCIIMNNGRVACVEPCQFTAFCKDIGIKNWPFDVQNCTFTFGNWMKSGEELNYEAEKIKLVTKGIFKSNQWQLLTATMKVDKGKYHSMNETYPSVTFAFVIERHNGFHVATIFGAAIVLILCNLMTFWIKHETILRILLSGGILIGNNYYLSFLYWM